MEMTRTVSEDLDGAAIRDELHRGAKLLMDAGEASSLKEALATLQRYRAAVYVDREVVQSPTFQAALLTLVNAGSRCLLGGINVVGCPEGVTQAILPGPPDLARAVEYWGGRLADEGDPGAPGVVLGSASPTVAHKAPVLRVTFDGWVGAVIPWNSARRLPESQEFTPSGVLAGALAASECFQHLRGCNARAMRRPVGLSLWRPDMTAGWDSPECRGPKDIMLPQKVWVIGLGHLGQAFLWTLMTLPYPRPAGASLTLQDFDRVKPSNESTSLLTFEKDRGEKKTRVVAVACEQRGFETVLVERPFDDKFQWTPQDPPIAFCGVDKPDPRRTLEIPGFPEVVEAGLGHEGEEYLAYAVHSFPAGRKAEHIWSTAAPLDASGESQLGTPAERLLDLPAYRDLSECGTGRCGLLEIAGASVAVPFVGAAVSTLAVAETLRAVMQGHRYELLEGTLRDLDHNSAICIGSRPKVTNLSYVEPR